MPRALLAQQAARTASASGAPLPARGELLIRGATVLTMDPAVPDLAAGDVHVRDGAIVAVAQRIEAPAAQVIDGAGMICIPGFIDTHFHLWNSMFRLFVRADVPDARLFPGDRPARAADGARGQLSLRPSRRRRGARRRRHHAAQLGAQHPQCRTRRRRVVGHARHGHPRPFRLRHAGRPVRRRADGFRRPGAREEGLDARQGRAAHPRHLLAQSRRHDHRRLRRPRRPAAY